MIWSVLQVVLAPHLPPNGWNAVVQLLAVGDEDEVDDFRMSPHPLHPQVSVLFWPSLYQLQLLSVDEEDMLTVSNVGLGK